MVETGCQENKRNMQASWGLYLILWNLGGILLVKVYMPVQTQGSEIYTSLLNERSCKASLQKAEVLRGIKGHVYCQPTIIVNMGLSGGVAFELRLEWWKSQGDKGLAVVRQRPIANIGMHLLLSTWNIFTVCTYMHMYINVYEHVDDMW